MEVEKIKEIIDFMRYVENSEIETITDAGYVIFRVNRILRADVEHAAGYKTMRLLSVEADGGTLKILFEPVNQN